MNFISTSKDPSLNFQGSPLFFGVSKQPKTIQTNFPTKARMLQPATCNALRAGTRSTGRIRTYHSARENPAMMATLIGGILSHFGLCKDL